MASLLSLEQTPSKKVIACITSPFPHYLICLQAAAAFAAFTLDSPTKTSKKDIIKVVDDEPLPQSPESLTGNVEDNILPIRRKFVGDVDLPESMSTSSRSLLIY